MKEKETNNDTEQIQPDIIDKINNMSLLALFEAIDNGEFEYDKDLIYIVTVKLIRISNGLIRQYSLDEEALYRMYRTYINTESFVVPADEN